MEIDLPAPLPEERIRQPDFIHPLKLGKAEHKRTDDDLETLIRVRSHFPLEKQNSPVGAGFNKFLNLSLDCPGDCVRELLLHLRVRIHNRDTASLLTDGLTMPDHVYFVAEPWIDYDVVGPAEGKRRLNPLKPAPERISGARPILTPFDGVIWNHNANVASRNRLTPQGFENFLQCPTQVFFLARGMAEGWYALPRPSCRIHP